MRVTELYESNEEIVKEFIIDNSIDGWQYTNGKLYVKGDVSLVEEYKQLPVCFSKVYGDFNASSNNLTTLMGMPEYIDGYFDVEGNLLRDLSGAPKEVRGYFDCQENDIISLRGCPNIVNDHFICRANNLQSLDGGPSIVRGQYNCSSNQLTSLKGMPKSCTIFKCYSNPIPIYEYRYALFTTLNEFQSSLPDVDNIINTYRFRGNNKADVLKGQQLLKQLAQRKGNYNEII